MTSSRFDPCRPSGMVVLMMSGNRKVVIVGGGFAGLNAARKLGNQSGVEVTVVDRRNHHLFQPLLYQVATAALSPAEIAVPIRSLLSRYANIRVILGEARQVDVGRKRLICDFGELDYDYLILAAGAAHSYFGKNQFEPWAPGLKTVEQATEIRRRILLAYEMAEREADPEQRRRLQTFVIVGAGPTGVELAGALTEISVFTLGKDFRNTNPKDTTVVLVDAAPRVLPGFPEELSERAKRDLEKMGVRIRLSTMVTEVNGEGVRAGDEFIPAGTVLWAAGVAPSPLNRTLGVELDKAGRVIVASDCSVPGHPEIFVLGDAAHFRDPEGKPLPGLAPVAIQQGRHVARLILDERQDKPRRPFRYRDKGTMATIGRRRAVAEAFGLRFGGFPAWIAWLVVHLYFLIGFRNRLLVLLEWGWSYLTFRRGARLIVPKEWQFYGEPPPHPRSQSEVQVEAENAAPPETKPARRASP